MMTIDATKIKIDLNYAKDKQNQPTPASVSNSHTGMTVKGQGNTVTSKVSMDNVKHTERRATTTTYRKKGEINMDSFTQPRELIAKRTAEPKPSRK